MTALFFAGLASPVLRQENHQQPEHEPPLPTAPHPNNSPKCGKPPQRLKRIGLALHHTEARCKWNQTRDPTNADAMMMTGCITRTLLLLWLLPMTAHAALPLPDFVRDIKPILTQFCVGCHGEKNKAGLDLRAYADAAAARSATNTFAKVLRNLEAHEMPPSDQPQPKTAQRKLITRWIETEILGCDCAHPDPGRVTLRRLNRVEYNNTIRDLLGVAFHPADDFPADDAGYGFDNIGDVLSLSPLLLEKYLTAAGKILEAANFPPHLGKGKSESSGLNQNTPAKQSTPLNPPAIDSRLEAAQEIIGHFARRAYRRPVTLEQTRRLMRFFEAAKASGSGFEASVKRTLQAVLVSPNFLFRVELLSQPDDANFSSPVDEFALASRLSYFLWSTMPDDELFTLAEKGRLRKNLESQVRRMLLDPKAQALTANFAGQWLQIRNLASASPDSKEFPNFDEPLRQAMESETQLFFGEIVRRNRSVLEFLNADYTFLNERLAGHYGIGDVKGTEFRRVNLRGARRGGVLTQASVLTVTSLPTRTSPVKRGKWVLDNILGTPPPPPPPNVPPFPENRAAAVNTTMRQRTEQHRADPVCSSCHARMDPIGFGFENFDAVGAWREKEGELPIDTAGCLTGGESFRGPEELKKILATTQREQFVRCLSGKLLTYALGRGLEFYDRCALDEITKAAQSGHFRFSSLVLGVVNSSPFQNRRRDANRPAASD